MENSYNITSISSMYIFSNGRYARRLKNGQFRIISNKTAQQQIQNGVHVTAYRKSSKSIKHSTGGKTQTSFKPKNVFSSLRKNCKNFINTLDALKPKQQLILIHGCKKMISSLNKKRYKKMENLLSPKKRTHYPTKKVKRKSEKKTKVVKSEVGGSPQENKDTHQIMTEVNSSIQKVENIIIPRTNQNNFDYNTAQQMNRELLRAMTLVNDKRQIMNSQIQQIHLIGSLIHLIILSVSLIITYEVDKVMSSVPNTMIHIVDRFSFGIGRITSYIGLGHPVESVFDFLREEFQETTYAFYAIIHIISTLLGIILYVTLLFAKRWVTEPLQINIPLFGFRLGQSSAHQQENLDRMTNSLISNLNLNLHRGARTLLLDDGESKLRTLHNVENVD